MKEKKIERNERYKYLIFSLSLSLYPSQKTTIVLVLDDFLHQNKHSNHFN